MADDERKSNSQAGRVWDALNEIKPVWITGAILVGALTVGGPFLPNAASQILANVLTAGITTVLSVYATYHSASQASARGAREELTRYGLLAWRNLDSLQLKLAQQLQRDNDTTHEMLQEWSLDVDQAKWAWRDLLREVFELEERLQTETYELAQDYRSKIRAAASPDEARKLEVEQVRELARLTSSSRLPLRIPTEVRCPYCGSNVNVAIGSNPGDTVNASCPFCSRAFFAHRGGDGALFTRQVASADGEVKSPLRYISPEAHLEGLKAVADVFGAAGDGRIQNWPTFFAQLRSRLSQRGSNPAHAQPIQRWLFHLKAFRLFGPSNGIGLVVPPTGLIGFVEQRVVGRLAGRASAEQICAWLYGTNSERLAAIQTLVNAFGAGTKQ